MAVKYIFFDLDGTLLPMDQEQFVKAYIKGLATKMAPHGFDPVKVKDGLWAGTGAMVKNDGARSNYDVFWDVFQGIVGPLNEVHMAAVDDFYVHEFQQVQQVCGYTPDAAPLIAKVKALGYIPVLATNPLFPRAATESRVRWAGLQPEDFALITVYDNSRHCKPNPEYYRDIVAELGADPTECVMIGNDAKEDMIAETLGMQVFLLTPCLINSEGKDISRYPQGDFAELNAFIENL